MRKQNKQVTVIIPTHNRQQVTLNAVDSVLKNSYQSIQLLIIDDGSSPPFKLPEKYDKWKNQITTVRLKKTKGVSAARNEGLSRASGSYIFFLDSDDEYTSSKIATQLKQMNRENADFSISNRIVKKDTNTLSQDYSGQILHITQSEILENGIPVSASLLAVSSSLAHIRFDESLPSANDLDYVLRVSSQSKRTLFIDSPLSIIHKSLNRPRISTDDSRKLKGYESILHRIETYNLKTRAKNILLQKIAQGITIFSLLSFEPSYLSKLKSNKNFHLKDRIMMRIGANLLKFEFLHTVVLGLKPFLWRFL